MPSGMEMRHRTRICHVMSHLRAHHCRFEHLMAWCTQSHQHHKVPVNDVSEWSDRRLLGCRHHSCCEIARIVNEDHIGSKVDVLLNSSQIFWLKFNLTQRKLAQAQLDSMWVYSNSAWLNLSQLNVSWLKFNLTQLELTWVTSPKSCRGEDNLAMRCTTRSIV